MPDDEKYMRRCLELAQRGISQARPNPLVGSVVVYNDEVLGESWHKKYGGPHAEVNALAEVDKPELLPVSTVYVNMEPCSHFGKTPPCADLLIEKKVRRVVIAQRDPYHEVAGRGLEKLRKAGIEVTEGVLENEALEVNRRFNTYHIKRRPYIVLKWAESASGYIGVSGEKVALSNDETNKMVHRWRSEEAAILVGPQTVINDNPELNVRLVDGPNPLKVVVDRNLRIPKSSKLLKEGSTRIYNLKKKKQSGENEWIKLDESEFIRDLMKDLFKKRILSVLVEGGAEILQHFIDLGLWDEARIIKTPHDLNTGIKAPHLEREPNYSEVLGNDTIEYYRNLE